MQGHGGLSAVALAVSVSRVCICSQHPGVGVDDLSCRCFFFHFVDTDVSVCRGLNCLSLKCST
jgi:hypothetical protein